MPHRTDPGRVAVAWFAATARRRAERVLEAGGGAFAVLDPQFPLSYEHNRVVAERDVDGLRLVGLADEILGEEGLTHRQVTVLTDVRAHDVDSFGRAGYAEHERLAAMACRPDQAVAAARPAHGVAVEQADEATLAPLIARLWHEEWLPAADDETIRQLVARRVRLDRAGTVHRLAVLDDDRAPVGSADVIIGQAAGVTLAEVDAVAVLAAHRGHGIGDALLSAAATVATDARADLMVLAADADDWPRRWYAERGYVEVGHQHSFTRR